MKYIKKVILENFQSHKYTEIEFDKYLNVIVGQSDQGKTAIIRGIKWALFNEPTGDYFIREGESECSVTIIFNNNIKLKRYRSKTKNYYCLYDSSGEETIFEGFGTKVPKEIIDKTSLRKILLDSNQSSSINIGEQLEGPFLLSEKNSTRANAIGRLVGVHIVDDALRETLKDIRNLNIKRRNHEEVLEKLQKNLTEYDYLDGLILKSKKLENIKENIYNKQQRLDFLNKRLEILNKVNNGISLLNIYLSQLKNLDKISSIEKQLTYNIRNFNNISNKYKRLTRIESDMKFNNGLLCSLKNIDNIQESVNNLVIISNKANVLKSILVKYNYTKKTIGTNKNLLDKLKYINDIEYKINHIERDYITLMKLHSLKTRLDKTNKSISLGNVYTEKMSAIEPAFNIKNLIDIKYKQLNNLLFYREKYYNNINILSDINKSLESIEIEMNNYLERYKTLLNKVEICPFCYSPIDKDRVSKIVDEYKYHDCNKEETN